jgi:GT2 family glycosyltransferase
MSESAPAAMNSPVVVAVTVTYGDRFGLLQAVAERLLADARIARWVIVANGVTPSLARKIEAIGDRVISRGFSSNVGSAPAYALGIKAAIECNADWVWLLDDDNLPAPDALEQLLAAHESLSQRDTLASCIAVCGYRDHIHGPQLRDGPRAPSSFLGFHLRTLVRRLLRRGASQPGRPSQALAVALAPYGGLLLPRALITRVGLPDPRFVLYADDTEYTDRIVRSGGKLYVVSDAVIDDLLPSWQDRSSLLRAWLDEPDSARVYYGARNEAWFDCHRLAKNRWLYRVHRAIYFAAWWLLSRREPRRTRFALLREAVRAGEAETLGPDARFSELSSPTPVAR